MRGVKDRANSWASSLLSRLGFSGRRASDVKRQAWWWSTARASAIERGGGLRGGEAVVFGAGGRVELLPLDVPCPTEQQVGVRALVSAISPGTERARYLGLPHAKVNPGYIPGFSVVGEVVEVGSAVQGLELGDRVVVLGGRHQSYMTVPASEVIPVPGVVSDIEAAFGYLGVIALHGVDLARPRGVDVAVLGLGVIGTLAQRLAVAEGATATVAIARTRRRRRGGAPAPANLIALEDDATSLDGVRFPVVIEASGAPEALDRSVSLAADSGRVVLLGSSRGRERQFPVADVHRRQLKIVGAHVRTAGQGSTAGPAELAARFLQHVAAGSIDVEDLVDLVADPREPEVLYRRLTRDASLVGAVFDWTSMAPRTGMNAWARRPELTGRGIDYAKLPFREPAVHRSAPRGPSRSARGDWGFAMVGCGDIATLNAAAVVAAPGAKLASVYDPVTELRDDLAQRFGTRAATSYEEVLERSDTDVVFLCVPHHLHAPLAKQALDAGKHVVVEKPPAQHLEAAVDMLTAVDGTASRLTICLPSRFEPASLAARWLVERGAIGNLSGGSVTFLADRPPGYYQGGLSGRTASDWRTDPSRSGGGVAIMNLAHELDLLLSLAGQDRVTSVSAQVAEIESPAGIEDAVAATLRFSGGGLVSVQGSAAVRGTHHGEFRLWGREGHLEVRPTPQLFSLRSVPGYRVGRWQRLARPTVRDPREAFVTDLVAALSSGESPHVSTDDALHLQAVIQAIYRSASTGSTVDPSALVREVRG